MKNKKMIYEIEVLSIKPDFFDSFKCEFSKKFCFVIYVIFIY